MPPATTRYFANSVDQNWDTLGNWWANAGCTTGFSGTLTGVTVTITDATVTCDSTAGLVVGRPITGTGIDTGSTVASITNGTEFELSLPAIANGSSNLSCELHVIPVTGNDVVIANGNGTVAGTPSADVLGLVTVNGDSNLNVTLAAANFEFNDTSYIDGDITGNVTFNDFSHNRGGTGGVGFPSYTGGITGDCTFNDSSYNGSGYNEPGGGTINGNATFHDDSWNKYNGGINGNATFTNAEYSSDPHQGFVSGTVTFSSLTPVKFTLTEGAWYSDTTGWVFDTAGQNWEFNGSGGNYGTITGNATFTEAEYSTALTIFNPQQGTVSGTVTFSSLTPVKFTLEGTEVWEADTTGWVFDTAGQNWELNSSSWVASNTGTIFGDCAFYTGFNHSTGTITGVCEFNNNSSNSGTITGNCTFNGSSNDGTITGNCELNGTSGNYSTIIGNCEYNDTSNNNTNGDVTGDCTFEDSSYNDGNITGNCTFNSIAWVPANTSTGTIIGNCDFSIGRNVGSVTGDCNFINSASSNGTITGNATFASGCYNDEGGTVTEDATFNGSGGNDGAVTGNATFNDTSYNLSGASVGGNASFTNTAFSTATTGSFDPVGTVSGIVDFPNGATFTLESGESWTAEATYWTGTLAWVLNGTSYIDGNITGNCTFNDYSYNIGGDGYTGGITGDCTFNDNSFNGLANVSSGYITGDCWFYNNSFNEYNGTITGNATFPESEYSTALQGPQGWSPGSGPQLGYVSGTVTFSSLTPVKFTLETGEVWRVDTTGWVFDTAGQNWEFNGESYNDTYGIINGDCVFNGGPSYPIPYQNQGTVNGNCVFNVYYGLDTGAVVNGDCVFNSTIVNGTITGNCTFNGYSFCNQGLVIIGNCTFNDTASLDGTVTGDCEFNGTSYIVGGTITGNLSFNDGSYISSSTTVTVSGTVFFNGSSYNAGTVTGNATVRQHAAAFTAWRDYATSTYITGTLTLQFPEMDVLGTGLL